MSVEYCFYPCKSNRIVGGFVRNLDGSFDYEPVFFGKSRVHWFEFESTRLRKSEIHPLDRELILGTDSEEADDESGFSNAFFVSKDFIEKMSEGDGWLKRGYMNKDDALSFIQSDYNLGLIDDGEVELLSAEEYAAVAQVLNEPYVQVAYSDWDSVEWVCMLLQEILFSYGGDADGFIVVAG